MFAHADKTLLSKIYIINDTDAFSLKLVFESVIFVYEFVHKFFCVWVYVQFFCMKNWSCYYTMWWRIGRISTLSQVTLRIAFPSARHNMAQCQTNLMNVLLDSVSRFSAMFHASSSQSFQERLCLCAMLWKTRQVQLRFNQQAIRCVQHHNCNHGSNCYSLESDKF